MSVTACQFSHTATEVRATTGPTTRTVQPAAPDARTVAGDFRYAEGVIVGQVRFAEQCVAVERRRITREQVTTTTPNKRTGAVWLVVGGVLMMLGTAFLVTASNDSSDCEREPGGGVAQCDEGAARNLWAGMLHGSVGAGMFIGGLVTHSRKPEVETKRLPSRRLRKVSRSLISCGEQTALEGLEIAVRLPEGRSSTGRVDATGAVRIAAPERPDASTPSDLVVHSVPPTATGVVAQGLVVGTVSHEAAPVAAESR
jgi:hypothetical protein